MSIGDALSRAIDEVRDYLILFKSKPREDWLIVAAIAAMQRARIEDFGDKPIPGYSDWQFFQESVKYHAEWRRKSAATVKSA